MSSDILTWFNLNQVVGIDSVCNTSILLVVEDNGCQATDEVYVSQPSPISTSYTKNDVTCHGGADGQIMLSVNGGTPHALVGYIW